MREGILKTLPINCMPNFSIFRKVIRRLAMIFICACIAGFGMPLVAKAADDTGKIMIVSQPEDILAAPGSYKAFEVEATGDCLSYQWYYKKISDPSWVKWYGKTAPLFSVKIQEGQDRMLVRCAVTDEAGNEAVSEAAQILVAPEINTLNYGIIGQQQTTFLGNPSSVNISGFVGDTFRFKVNVSGVDLTYQWYYKKSGQKQWTVWDGKTGQEVQDVIGSDWDGFQVKCNVTAGNGQRAVSAAMKIKVHDNGQGQASEVDLYALDEIFQNNLTIPAGYAQSYPLGGDTAKIVRGDGVSIEDGAAVPKFTTRYYHQIPGSSYWVESSAPSGAEGEIVKRACSYEDTIVLIDGKKITFHVVNYAKQYSQEIMDRYLAYNLTPGMTDYEKAQMCCKFVAEGYDYSTEASSYTGMIVTGGGDCWASTDALLYMLKKLGIECKGRDAAGATGSQHRNVLAILDGTSHILDAGYDGKKPRAYTLEAYGESPYRYSKLSDGTISIVNFVNILDETAIEIPDTIDGYKVTKIAGGAFRGHGELVSVVIPDTVTSIGERAFYQNDSLEKVQLPSGLTSVGANCFAWDESLKSIDIPSSVTELGAGCFLYCDALERISVDAGNRFYADKDGVLFDKAKETLIRFPGGKSGSSYAVPGSVTTIGGWAFARITLKSLSLPEGLREFGDHSFYMAKIPEIEVPKGVASIASYAFQSSNIDKVSLPDTLTRIEDYAFYRSGTESIRFPARLLYIGENAFAGDAFLKRGNIPKSVAEIGAHAFDLAYGWSSMGESSKGSLKKCIVFEPGGNAKIGEEAFSDTAVCAVKGSIAHQYAVQNQVPYVELNQNGKIDINGRIVPPSESYPYEGAAVKPALSWKDMPFSLLEGLDYKVKYSNNAVPGTAKIKVKGLGICEGEAAFEYNILENTIYLPRTREVKDGVEISWSTFWVSGKETTYKIYRKEEGEADYKLVESSSGFCWTDTDIKKGKVYFYQLYAYTDADLYKTYIEIRYEPKERPEEEKPKICYRIRYDLNGGQELKNPTSYAADELPIVLSNPVRDGYLFAGWTGSNGNIPQAKVVISKGMSGDLSYTANWEENREPGDDSGDTGSGSDTGSGDSTGDGSSAGNGGNTGSGSDTGSGDSIGDGSGAGNGGNAGSGSGTGSGDGIGDGNSTGIGDKGDGSSGKLISIEKAKVSGIKPGYTYTGKKFSPVPLLKVNNVLLNKGTDFTVSYKSNKNVGTAVITVKGKGKYTGTKKVNFKINPKGTVLGKLTKGKKKITVRWKKQAVQTSGYEIHCSTNRRFAKKATRISVVRKASAVSVQIKNLKAKKRYFIKMRTYKTVSGRKYYSVWSKTKSIRLP